MIVFNKKVINYLTLNGDINMTIYQGADYIEPGYRAYNSDDEDLTSQVKIMSNLDTDKLGEYEITYILDDISITRKIIVVESPKEYTYIYLNKVNNSVDMYLQVGDKYEEPGYKVYSSTGVNLTSKVKITGFVDTFKKGVYEIVYSVVDSKGVTVSESRTVIVMDIEINLSLSNDKYTNKSVYINIMVNDSYCDYIVLPNNEKINNNSYSYKVDSNGIYKFKVYNQKGMEKEASIEVLNIDKVAPTGSCKLDNSNSGSIITVSADDDSGIKKYVYNCKDYTNGNITLSSYIDSAKISIYDNAGNVKEISCKSTALPMITSISNDGVIVSIKAKKANANIVGYYFSYTNKRPDKNTGGYLATNKDSVDVVRLPGTTYVWVEDSAGKISKPMTINLSNKVLPFTANGYSILRGTKLRDFLGDKGWSLDEFNKLIARSVRAAGLYTKVGAATAAVSMEVVLAQKYGIKILY